MISFVAELMCIRANVELMDPYYLLQMLSTKTYYLLLNREKRGQTSHIYPRDIENILVPVPDLEVQKESAMKYVSMYTQYRSYLEEAERFVTRATSEFESNFLPG